jgi:hypothetical protein
MVPLVLGFLFFTNEGNVSCSKSVVSNFSVLAFLKYSSPKVTFSGFDRNSSVFSFASAVILTQNTETIIITASSFVLLFGNIRKCTSTPAKFVSLLTQNVWGFAWSVVSQFVNRRVSRTSSDSCILPLHLIRRYITITGDITSLSKNYMG